nr:Chain C, peptide from Virion membrane protein A14 [Vaccinia virus WR]4N8V_F Chain F, peptide from Virion membrane protein A14 [Vaccinia virus WR]
MLIYSMWGK